MKKNKQISFEIEMKRKEIELDLHDLLVESNVNKKIGVEHIKRLIYEESETDDMQDILAIFDNGDIDNLSNVLETVTEAWNYFPHKTLKGLSPIEILRLN